ncbi:MAG TPA: TVP38/TMEM64 family protein [Verrucomicrobiae bacterium]|jgi:uncharacterized membrane protein YdjX (TVP38/TMEM64 family)|nr:TVP38/TMEM64 family protein [Verrucomicrobiae bacterium]
MAAPKAFFKAFTAAVILGCAYYFNKAGLFQRTLEWIQGLGPWAPAVFLGVYILTCIFFAPSFVFTFASGILFGLWKGTLLSVLGAGLGSTAAFLIGRTMARDVVAKAFAANREFQALQEAVKEKGWKIILLARLSPIFPFLVGNYAFGLTRIPPAQYFFATMVGTLPSSTVYVYLGTITGNLALVNASGRTRTPAEWALLAVGLAATVGLSLYLRGIATKALKKNVPHA